MARCDHPSADDIYLDVRAKDDRISRGTVYRNLNVLSEKEEITHVRVPGSDRYDSRLEKHYHMICYSCGSVTDVPVPYDSDIDGELRKVTGFDINRHRLIFEGTCPECQKKEKRE